MPPRKAWDLDLLLDCALLLSSQLELPELLKTVLELASRVVNAETASLLLLDESTQELYFDTALGLDQSLSSVRLKLGQGIAGTVAQTREPAIINSARKDPRWSAQIDERSGFVTRSILAVPILIKGRLVGVVEAINKRRGLFTENDLKTFSAFASQAGVAIETARLFASLRDEKFKLATVFAQMRDGAVLADTSGRVLLANEAADRLWGVGLRNLEDALKEMTVVPPLAKLLQTDDASFTATRAEPTLLVVAGRVTSTPLDGGKACLFIFRDETESSLQDRLKHSFLSLISHKLKTPLSSMIGFSDVLLGETNNKFDLETLKALKTVSSEGLKLSKLVDKLIRYATIENADVSPEITDVAIDEVVAEAVKALRETIATRQAKIKFKPCGLTVPLDRDMFVELVKNLIDNAVKFDPKPAPIITVRARIEGTLAKLSVADQGPGIPPEAQQAVFSGFHQIEKDFTGQKEGIGLGLPFVKKVAKLHGGTATVISRLGVGTEVIVEWPLQKIG